MSRKRASQVRLCSTPEEYLTHGYTVLRGAIRLRAIAGFRRVLARRVDQLARALKNQGSVQSSFSSSGFATRLARLCAQAGTDTRKWGDDLACAELFEIASSPDLVAALCTIHGAEVVFHDDYQVRPKLPGSLSSSFPWHQDTSYYGEPSRHLHITTAWVPLVAADERNGCIWVLPASHRMGLVPARRGAFEKIYPVEDIERRGTPIAVPVSPGDVLLMSNLTFHKSDVNRSDGVRWSLDLGYSDASSGGSARRRASRRFVFGSLSRRGREPAVVASADPARVDTWKSWSGRFSERSVPGGHDV